MQEQPLPKYLRPEALASESERAESPAAKTERAIGSTSELVSSSASALDRAGKQISGLREGAARGRLEKRQGILARRLSSFQKKIAATLAGLAITAGVGRTGREAARKPSEQDKIADVSAATRGASEETFPNSIVTDSEIEEDDEVDDEQPSPATNADPFAVPGEKVDDALEAMIAEEVAEAEENLKFEEVAKQEELAAMRDYAELVIDDALSTNTDLYRGKFDELHDLFREKAKEIGADEEEFIHQADEAYLDRYGSVTKKVMNAPDTITPEEQPIADEVRRQMREAEAGDDNATGPTDDTQE